MLDLGRFTYINADFTAFEVDDKTTYTVTDSTVFKYNGKTIAIGVAEALAYDIYGDASVVGVIQLGDKVTVDGNVVTITESADLKAAADAAAAADQAAADVVIALLDAAAMDPTDTGFNASGEVAAARTAYDGLTAAQKALVTNYAKLTAAEAAVAQAAAVADVIAATDKYEMRTAVNDNLEVLGIDSAITLEAADYLFTKKATLVTAQDIIDALADFAAL